MFDLSQFELNEMTLVGAKLRRVGQDAPTFERACQAVSEFFWREFVDSATGQPAFALTRCYKTHPFGQMPPELSRFAAGVFPDRALSPTTQCLTLLGTYGDRDEWRSRLRSNGHQAIPLIDERTVESLPMVSRLVQALGINAFDIVNPDPTLLLEKDRQGFNVFHIESALGSAHIPAQDFVTSAGVRSVVGFGFVVPPASVFATILFSHQTISTDTANLFKTLALSLKLALMPLVKGKLFDEVGAQA
jgi:hypothetical protein